MPEAEPSEEEERLGGGCCDSRRSLLRPGVGEGALHRKVESLELSPLVTSLCNTLTLGLSSPMNFTPVCCGSFWLDFVPLLSLPKQPGLLPNPFPMCPPSVVGGGSGPRPPPEEALTLVTKDPCTSNDFVSSASMRLETFELPLSLLLPNEPDLSLRLLKEAEELESEVIGLPCAWNWAFLAALGGCGATRSFTRTSMMVR